MFVEINNKNNSLDCSNLQLSTITLYPHTQKIIVSLVLYSQTKGVKQKYILCISGLVAYRQYIHNCSSPEDSYWLSPLIPWTCLCRGSPLLSLDSAMTHSR